MHSGGTDTAEQLPIRSSIQKPGHITSGRIHMCKHIGTRPPVGTVSSLLWGVVHRGKREEHIMLMYDEKHALYISSLVLPTLRAYVCGNLQATTPCNRRHKVRELEKHKQTRQHTHQASSR